jgi:hypothetical protein
MNAKKLDLAGSLPILVGPFLTYGWTTDKGMALLALLAAAIFTIFTRMDDLVELSCGPLKPKCERL